MRRMLNLIICVWITDYCDWKSISIQIDGILIFFYRQWLQRRPITRLSFGLLTKSWSSSHYIWAPERVTDPLAPALNASLVLFRYHRLHLPIDGKSVMRIKHIGVVEILSSIPRRKFNSQLSWTGDVVWCGGAKRIVLHLFWNVARLLQPPRCGELVYWMFS